MNIFQDFHSLHFFNAARYRLDLKFDKRLWTDKSCKNNFHYTVNIHISYIIPKRIYFLSNINHNFVFLLLPSPPKPLFFISLSISLFHHTCQMMCVDWLQSFANNPVILVNQQVQFSFWFMVIHDESLICAARKRQRARTQVANGIHGICLTRFLLLGICCESNKRKQPEKVSNLNS